jgi:hypothetical protein
MFKATYKRRATTLSKTLLTAGLLGGAALSTLGAGSAQAAEISRESCAFGGAASVHPTCDSIFTSPTAGWTLGDKFLSNLLFSPIAPPSGEFTFIYADGNSYVTEASFDPSLPPPYTGSYTYDLAITPAGIANGWVFDSVELDVDHFNNGVEVTKTVVGGVPSPVVLESVDGAPDGPVPLGGTSITVTDSWIIEPTSNGGIVSITNTYTQEVPAPLPLLGVGAAFGSIRKLRKFSSQLKTFSMG